MNLFASAIASPVLACVVLLACSNLFKLDYLWAGLCLMGAVYFIFRA